MSFIKIPFSVIKKNYLLIFGLGTWVSALIVYLGYDYFKPYFNYLTDQSFSSSQLPESSSHQPPTEPSNHKHTKNKLKPSQNADIKESPELVELKKIEVLINEYQLEIETILSLQHSETVTKAELVKKVGLLSIKIDKILSQLDAIKGNVDIKAKRKEIVQKAVKISEIIDSLKLI